MTESPLSRYTGQHPKPRPTHTLIAPNRGTANRVIGALLDADETFTVEPSPTAPGAWHIGVFESGKNVAIPPAGA